MITVLHLSANPQVEFQRARAHANRVSDGLVFPCVFMVSLAFVCLFAISPFLAISFRAARRKGHQWTRTATHVIIVRKISYAHAMMRALLPRSPRRPLRRPLPRPPPFSLQCRIALHLACRLALHIALHLAC